MIAKAADQYPKRLIEVDRPIKRISAHATDEKDSRCGHIPRLHIYPAARPLAACRAVLCATLWPDPGDDHCPESFRKVAREQLGKWANNHLSLLSQDSYPRFLGFQKNVKKLKDNMEMRNALLDFIADFSDSDNSTRPEYLETARILTQVAHDALSGTTGTRPVVVDPFAGGGAIPLEALRVGASSFSSDSNPLAVLLNKVALQYAPRYGKRLADAVLEWGKEVNKHARESLHKYYPHDKGCIPIAYLWARTVLSESPDTATIPIEVPLIRSMWLSRKGRLAALRWKRNAHGVVQTKVVKVRYANGTTVKVRQPELEVFCPKKPSDVEKGTVSRNSATCPLTGFTTPASSVQTQLKKRQGGASDARLYCVVSTNSTGNGRIYALPSEQQEEAYDQARNDFDRLRTQRVGALCIFPDEALPVMSGVFNAPLYGHSTWGSLFNCRQAIALTTYVRLAREVIASKRGEDKDFGEALAAVLALAIDRLADLNASLCVWQLSTPNTAHVFGRWALPMIMDYGEVNPLAGGGGSPESAVWRIAAAINDIAAGVNHIGDVELASADQHPLPEDFADVLFTDPPYYNAVPYADISDFFYVWLKRTVRDVFPSLLKEDLSPKDVEICEMSGWDPVRYPHKDKLFFELHMCKAAAKARAYVKPSGIGVVVFAHKTTAGWEALLQALIDAGWIVTASWPIDTEMASRLRAKNSAALASSVHLVCRPRENPDGSVRTVDVGDWREVLSELPKRIHDWMPRLAEEGVVGADAIFACLGPALEIFSRYSRVEKASGEAVTLKEYLEQVWAAVSKEALNMIFKEADASGFEEDARLTAMWLWTLATGDQESAGGNETDESDEDEEHPAKGKTKGGFSLEYDAARKIAQGLGVHLEDLTHLVEAKGEIATLLPVAARTRYLFGKDSAEAPKGRPKKKDNQLTLNFESELKQIEKESDDWTGELKGSAGRTILDQLHQSMILFAAGRGEALKRFLVEDGIGKNSMYWRLAQAMSALYPPGTDEKRWVDGVLARKKGLGL